MNLSAKASLVLTGGQLNANFPGLAIAETPASEVHVANTQAVGTSAEALVVGDIGTAGWGAFYNADPTNYVELSMAADGTTPFAKIKALQFALIPLASKVIYAKANTAGINLEYVITSA